MWDLIKDFWRVLRKRDAESAACMIIGLSDMLDARHLREMAEFLKELEKIRNVR